MKSYLSLAVFFVLLTACVTPALIVKRGGIPKNSTIGIIQFKDCTISGADCNGSGNILSDSCVSILKEDGRFNPVLIPRPIGALDDLSDNEAINIGKKMNIEFVINSEVIEYQKASLLLLKPNTVSIKIKLIRISDGKILMEYQDRRAASMVTEPASIGKELLNYFIKNIICN